MTLQKDIHMRQSRIRRMCYNELIFFILGEENLLGL